MFEIDLQPLDHAKEPEEVCGADATSIATGGRFAEPVDFQPPGKSERVKHALLSADAGYVSIKWQNIDIFR